MCTALSLTTNDHYFGRTLDLACSLGESVIIVPRRFPLPFRFGKTIAEHPAIIGVGVIRDGYPLYYDAVNEYGLAAAGLNFPGCAEYQAFCTPHSIASFELIPRVLGCCRSAQEAKALLETASISNTAFSDALPPSPLHWMVSDKASSLVIEPLNDGLHIHDNPAGVMTNSPSFDEQLALLRDYAGIQPDDPKEAISLPGGWSSCARFVRAAYLRRHSASGETEAARVSQFFHILDAVSVVRGSVLTDQGQEITQYASCCNTRTGVYSYTTYENRAVTTVDLHAENLNSARLIQYPFITQLCIHPQNAR